MQVQFRGIGVHCEKQMMNDKQNGGRKWIYANHHIIMGLTSIFVLLSRYARRINSLFNGRAVLICIFKKKFK